MADLPTGTVTFLFTDIEGSTRLWEQHPQTMEAALGGNDALAAEIICWHRGVEVCEWIIEALPVAVARARSEA